MEKLATFCVVQSTKLDVLAHLAPVQPRAPTTTPASAHQATPVVMLVVITSSACSTDQWA